MQIKKIQQIITTKGYKATRSMENWNIWEITSEKTIHYLGNIIKDSASARFYQNESSAFITLSFDDMVEITKLMTAIDVIGKKPESDARLYIV